MENLVDPGPNLVICDEGHVLKNTKSALNQAMNKVKTRRRVILTGTPLQNNLSEYFAMVDFVKPKLLGTYNEFRNRFVNPITNGQSSDSTERDVRIMKKRSFILNDLLKGCMQRLDYNVLVPFLQVNSNLFVFVMIVFPRKFQPDSDFGHHRTARLFCRPPVCHRTQFDRLWRNFLSSVDTVSFGIR